MGVYKPLALETLIISHPELQPGLTTVIPPGERPSHYLNRYHADHKVRCAFCDKHTPHNRGFTAQMEDGRVALCGKDCADEYFGKEDAKKFAEELEKQIRRASKRKIIQRTLDGIPAALELVTDELIAMERQALEATYALSREFRHSGVLTKLTEQGTYEHKEARRRWVEQKDKYGATIKVPIDEERVILKVNGASILRGGDNRQPLRFERAKQDLKMLAKAKPENNLSDMVVDRMTEKRSRILSDISNATRFLDLCARFFTKDNIRALSKLTSHVQTNAESIALHKRPHGFDLIITPYGYTDDPAIFNQSNRRVSCPLPDFVSRPSVQKLLAPLKEDHAQT